jgi:hypothetical protein
MSGTSPVLMSDHPLDNAVRRALPTRRRAFAEVRGRARRYQHALALFAACDQVLSGDHLGAVNHRAFSHWVVEFVDSAPHGERKSQHDDGP